ncbi:hypothetical protein FE257_009972 [Aspergillus nanangensis]|uniref:FAD dependent oxidoreductase domain-containing protein n=1 Tax=Aspergillus nanangensis TaxID=2582783 RepID=A0AAD4GYB2_ASPNN|nr:hypothetical protein FE257_009972 [Aspergillus nanangensis]
MALIVEFDCTSKPPSIVILEAHQACSGATARNGGQLKPDSFHRASSLARDYGIDAAEKVAAFKAKHLAAFQSLMQMENLSVTLRSAERMMCILTRVVSLRLEVDNYQDFIDKGSRTVKKTDIIPQELAESVSSVIGALGGLTYPTGRLWPYKFVMQLLERLVSIGINLQTYTPVLGVSDSTHANERWEVRTDRGVVRAKRVVFSTNEYTSTIAPQYKGKIVPVRGVCGRTVVPNPPEHAMENSYILRFNDWHFDYLASRPDGSIIVGGVKPTFYHDTAQWYNNTDDSEVSGSAIRYFDDYMQRHFHDWQDTGAYTDRVWTGIMGYTTDGLPYVGIIPNKPGQLVLARFNGRGMPQVFLTAEGLAQMIVDGVGYEDTGLPRLFKTNKEPLENQKSQILSGVEEKTM